MFETDENPRRDLLDLSAAPLSSPRESTRARMPGDGFATAELARLRRRVSRQDEAIVHMAQVLLRLRRGGDALRDENRELRLALAAARRAGPAD